MALTAYVGETVRVTAEALTHADSGPVTTGATVTVGVYDALGDQVGTDENATAHGSDWSVDVAAPDDAGEYTVKVVAEKNGATWKGKEPLSVRAF